MINTLISRSPAHPPRFYFICYSLVAAAKLCECNGMYIITLSTFFVRTMCIENNCIYAHYYFVDVFCSFLLIFAHFASFWLHFDRFCIDFAPFSMLFR